MTADKLPPATTSFTYRYDVDAGSGKAKLKIDEAREVALYQARTRVPDTEVKIVSERSWKPPAKGWTFEVEHSRG